MTLVDVAVVLGNKVELNGEPSERLKYRLDKAIELYQ
jgi:vancomycin permeability regulator SanA